jgi:hypothetical protein
MKECEKMLRTDIRIFGVAMIVVGALGGSAVAQPTLAGNSCQVALTSLVNEWNAVSFAPPSKPGQAIVAGKDGHVTSAGQFAYMTGLIRQARLECDRGDTASAIEHIAVVQDRLDRSRPNG